MPCPAPPSCALCHFRRGIGRGSGFNHPVGDRQLGLYGQARDGGQKIDTLRERAGQVALPKPRTRGEVLFNICT